MDLEDFSCCVCQDTYNNTDRIPRIIPVCGHSLCSSCIRGMIQANYNMRCPLDNRLIMAMSLNDFPINYAFKQVLEKKIWNANFCRVHQEEMMIVCLTDGMKICSGCLLSGEHEGHKTKHISVLRSKAKNKKQEIETIRQQFDTYHRSLLYILETAKERFLGTLESEVELFERALYKMKEKLTAEIEDFFALEHMKLENIIEDDIKIMGKLENMALICETEDSSSAEFFDALEAKLPEFKEIMNHLEFEDCISTLEEEFQKEIKSLNEVLLPSLRQFQFSFVLKGEFPLNNLMNAYRHLFGFEINEDKLILSTQGREFETEDTPAFTEGLNGLRQVSKLKVEFNSKYYLKEIAQSLHDVWNQLNNVTEFEMELQDNRIRDQEMLQILDFNSWANRNTQSFKINTKSCQAGDKSFIKLFTEILPRAISLKKLALNLKGTLITDQSIISFLQVVPLIQELEEFSLSLNSISITDEAISQIFVPMQKVQIFALDLDATSITDNGIHNLAGITFPSMKELRHLRLHFYQTALTDDTVSRLFIQMPYLEVLELELGTTMITDASIMRLAEITLPSINALKTFKLGLYNTKITDQCLIPLFPQLYNVENFELNVSFTQVTDVSICVFINHTYSTFKELRKFNIKYEFTAVSEEVDRTLQNRHQDLKTRFEVF